MVSEFLLNNSKGDLYKVIQGVTWYMFKLKTKFISRSALARFANCHKDTVSEINMRLEAAGIFQIEREYKQVNGYSTSLLKVLAIIFGYSPKCWLSSTSLIDQSSSYINNYLDIGNQKYVFSCNKVSNKGEEIGKVVFSPITGLYCPLELRPLNNTIEVSYADNIQSIGTSVGKLFPDYERIEKDRIRREAICLQQMQLQEAARQRSISESGRKSLEAPDIEAIKRSIKLTFDLAERPIPKKVSNEIPEHILSLINSFK